MITMNDDSRATEHACSMPPTKNRVQSGLDTTHLIKIKCVAMNARFGIVGPRAILPIVRVAEVAISIVNIWVMRNEEMSKIKITWRRICHIISYDVQKLQASHRPEVS
jgi:hypothetical protein